MLVLMNYIDHATGAPLRDGRNVLGNVNKQGDWWHSDRIIAVVRKGDDVDMWECEGNVFEDEVYIYAEEPGWRLLEVYCV